MRERKMCVTGREITAGEYGEENKDIRIGRGK